jgi:hypothetical protein
MQAQQNVLRVAATLLIVAVVSACLPQLPRLRPDRDDPANIETTLFLIGDAGEPDPREIGAPLDSLTAQAATAPQRSIVIFLGDNVYPEGIPEEGRAELADSRRRLAAQVQAVPPGARGIFMPGNHDWGAASAFGLYSLRNQERMIASLAREQGRDVRMMPSNGCPGPVALDVARLRLIIIDTQWWLHEFIVRDSASRCANGTLGSVTAALRNQVKPSADVPGQIVMVAGHHPLMTGGEHGGYCSITGPFRRLGVNSQDVMSTSNSRMRDSIEAALESSEPLIYAAGHDHNLQVLHGGRAAKYLLVSGAGSWSKVSCAVRLRESHFTSQHRSGFMRIDVLKDRGVLLRVYRFTDSGSGGLAFSRWLEPREP